MNNEIKAGDVVQVDFNNAQVTLCLKATVVRRPCATGDSWIFRDGDFLHYVSEGCTVTMRDAATPPAGKEGELKTLRKTSM